MPILFLYRAGFCHSDIKRIYQITFSEMRATVLSIRNFVIRLMFAAMAPLVGWLHDLYSLSIALQATAVIIFVPGLLFLILQYRYKPKEPSV